MNTEEIVEGLVEQFDLETIDLAKCTFSISELLVTLIELESIKEAALALDILPDRLESIIRRKLKVFFPEKKSREKWSCFLLGLVNYRKCPKCHKLLEYSHFYIETRHNGLSTYCKTCEKDKSLKYRHDNLDTARQCTREHYYDNKEYYLYKNALRRAAKVNATPIWADLDKIKEVYSTCPEGFHVDHEYPLISNWVCGLHVHENLQHLSAKENLQKGNRR